MMMPNIGISNRLIPNTVTAIMIKLNMRIKIQFGSGKWESNPMSLAYETNE